jgi:hypothetical protein
MGMKESVGGDLFALDLVDLVVVLEPELELGGRSRGDTGPLRASSPNSGSVKVAGDDMVTGFGLLSMIMMGSFLQEIAPPVKFLEKRSDCWGWKVRSFHGANDGCCRNYSQAFAVV